MFARSTVRLFNASLRSSSRAFSSTTFQTKPLISSKAWLALLGVGTGVFALSAPLLHMDDVAVDYAKVREDILQAMDEDAEKREDASGIGGMLVRLAWHASGTYSAQDKSGGSNGGRIRHSPESGWGANAGLDTARDFLEPIKAKHPNLTYADLYTLAGVVAIEAMGGPKVEWHAGRQDFADGSSSPPDGRLPNADMGHEENTIQHIRDVFGRMGFNDREMVALIGAHAVGRCHENASGYEGPWTFGETTFSNEFFRLLLEDEWTAKKTHQGGKWTGPYQYENKTQDLMMLPTDVALTRDREFGRWVHMYAEDEDLFFSDFASAFSKLIHLGVPSAPVSSSSSSGGIFGTIKGLLGMK